MARRGQGRGRFGGEDEDRFVPPLLLSPSGTTDAYTTDAGPSTARASWCGGQMETIATGRTMEREIPRIDDWMRGFTAEVDKTKDHRLHEPSTRTRNGVQRPVHKSHRSRGQTSNTVCRHRLTTAYNPDDMFDLNDVPPQKSDPHRGVLNMIERTTRALIYQVFPFLHLEEQNDLFLSFEQAFKQLIICSPSLPKAHHGKDLASAIHDLDQSSNESDSPKNKIRLDTPWFKFTHYAIQILAFLVGILLSAMLEVSPIASVIFRQPKRVLDMALQMQSPSGILIRRLVARWHRHRRKRLYDRSSQRTGGPTNAMLGFDRVLESLHSGSRSKTAHSSLPLPRAPPEQEVDSGNKIQATLGSGEVDLEALQLRSSVLGALATARTSTRDYFGGPTMANARSHERTKSRDRVQEREHVIRESRPPMQATRSGPQEAAGLRPLMLSRTFLSEVGHSSRSRPQLQQAFSLRQDLPTTTTTTTIASAEVNKGSLRPLLLTRADSRNFSASSSASNQEHAMNRTLRSLSGPSTRQPTTLGELSLPRETKARKTMTTRPIPTPAPIPTTVSQDQSVTTQDFTQIILEALRLQSESFQAERQDLLMTLLQTRMGRRGEEGRNGPD